MVAPFKYDLWTAEPVRDDENITVHCFMPNGNYIYFNCSLQMTLFEMKEVRGLNSQSVSQCSIYTHIDVCFFFLLSFLPTFAVCVCVLL